VWLIALSDKASYRAGDTNTWLIIDDPNSNCAGISLMVREETTACNDPSDCQYTKSRSLRWVTRLDSKITTGQLFIISSVGNRCIYWGKRLLAAQIFTSLATLLTNQWHALRLRLVITTSLYGQCSAFHSRKKVFFLFALNQKKNFAISRENFQNRNDCLIVHT